MLDTYEEHIGDLTIRNRELASLWGRRMRTGEVPWSGFWAQFPEGLPDDVDLGVDLSSPTQRAAFQEALYVVGSPEHISAAALDSAFPPGQSLKETIARYLLRSMPAPLTQIFPFDLIT